MPPPVTQHHTITIYKEDKTSIHSIKDLIVLLVGIKSHNTRLYFKATSEVGQKDFVPSNAIQLIRYYPSFPMVTIGIYRMLDKLEKKLRSVPNTRNEQNLKPEKKIASDLISDIRRQMIVLEVHKSKLENALTNIERLYAENRKCYVVTRIPTIAAILIFVLGITEIGKYLSSDAQNTNNTYTGMGPDAAAGLLAGGLFTSLCLLCCCSCAKNSSEDNLRELHSNQNNIQRISNTLHATHHTLEQCSLQQKKLSFLFAQISPSETCGANNLFSSERHLIKEIFSYLDEADSNTDEEHAKQNNLSI